jgi:hypothetical protein
MKKGRPMRLKQLLPFRYATGYVRYYDDGPAAEFATWRMWFGRIFRHRVVKLGQVIPPAVEGVLMDDA